jgi:hypothetical protein
MNIVRKLDLTTVAAAGGANPLSTARGQGDADDGQVLATERPPDGLMPPRKKRRGSARQQTALSALVADSAGVGGADTQHRSPSADESEASSQQVAADSVYHEFLRSLTPEQLDFVRKDEQWPAIRTSANKTAKPSVAPHKKNDWSSQRSGFVKNVFLAMYEGSESDDETLLRIGAMKVAKSLRSTPRVGAACTVRRFVLLCWRAAGAADHGTAPAGCPSISSSK